MSKKTVKKEINPEEFKVHENDSGSANYQVARMTARIVHLTDHLNTHTKDYASRRGLLRLVAQRRKLLDYLKRTKEEQYKELIQKLGLRR